MVFSIDFLHRLRQYELELVAQLLVPGARVLEVGAGTGFQARELQSRGFNVTAIDVRQSNYTEERVFPVIDYDGKTFPVADRSIDVVFSSNVLEHILNLDTFHRETRRVLRPGGYCIHLMPTGAWRFWTTLTGWADILPASCPQLRGLLPWPLDRATPRRVASAGIRLIRAVGARVIPLRHGERGTALTELWTFSRAHWVRHFIATDFEIISATPTGLFYTGYMFLGSHLRFERRIKLSRWLGSACVVYRVRPKPVDS